MQRIFASNTLLKIISVIIAIILWAYIIIVIDAPTEKVFREVPINTVNTQGLTDSGYCIEKLSVQTASVKLRGSRKVIAKFDSDNISAVLDMSDVNTSRLAEDGAVTVKLGVASEFGDVVSFTPSTVDIHLETVKYKDVDVHWTESGDLIRDYAHGDIELSQNKIRIFGAQENIDKVGYAGINVDFINVDYASYAGGRMKQKCDVRLYDSDENELSDKEKRWIWIGSDTVMAECPLYKIRSLPVEINADGSLAGTALTSEPHEIRVYGDNTLIEGLEHIMTKPVTKTDFEQNGEVTVRLDLPEWAKTVDDISEVRVRENVN